MRLGIFAKTFETVGSQQTFEAVAWAGYQAAQFNFACLGMPSMPDAIDPAASLDVREAAMRCDVAIAGVSGTYNMIHPDPSARRLGLARLEVVCAATVGMGADLVTICTGTRDPDDQWRWHPDNASSDAWRDLMSEMEAAVRIAEKHKVKLGVEPELANVVSGAREARRLLDELASPNVCVVLDPANLFEVANAKERCRVVDEAIDLLAGSIGMAHAKDRTANGGFTAAGQGVIDFAHFVERLKQAGFCGPLITHGLDAAEAPQTALFLKDILSKAGCA
jgi:sugar phosphate isomerase/epimerase